MMRQEHRAIRRLRSGASWPAFLAWLWSGSARSAILGRHRFTVLSEILQMHMSRASGKPSRDQGTLHRRFCIRKTDFGKRRMHWHWLTACRDILRLWNPSKKIFPENGHRYYLIWQSCRQNVQNDSRSARMKPYRWRRICMNGNWQRIRVPMRVCFLLRWQRKFIKISAVCGDMSRLRILWSRFSTESCMEILQERSIPMMLKWQTTMRSFRPVSSRSLVNWILCRNRYLIWLCEDFSVCFIRRQNIRM